MLNKTRRQYTFHGQNCKLRCVFRSHVFVRFRADPIPSRLFRRRFAVIFVFIRNFRRLPKSWKTRIFCFAIQNASGSDVSITFVCGFSIYGNIKLEFLNTLCHNISRLLSFSACSSLAVSDIILYILPFDEMFECSISSAPTGD